MSLWIRSSNCTVHASLVRP